MSQLRRCMLCLLVLALVTVACTSEFESTVEDFNVPNTFELLEEGGLNSNGFRTIKRSYLTSLDSETACAQVRAALDEWSGGPVTERDASEDFSCFLQRRWGSDHQIIESATAMVKAIESEEDIVAASTRADARSLLVLSFVKPRDL